MTEYQGGEFCKAVKCEIRLQLDDLVKGSDEYMQLKNICKTDCKKTAYEFHDWLDNNGYSIVK